MYPTITPFSSTDHNNIPPPKCTEFLHIMFLWYGYHVVIISKKLYMFEFYNKFKVSNIEIKIFRILNQCMAVADSLQKLFNTWTSGKTFYFHTKVHSCSFVFSIYKKSCGFIYDGETLVPLYRFYLYNGSRASPLINGYRDECL